MVKKRLHGRNVRRRRPGYRTGCERAHKWGNRGGGDATISHPWVMMELPECYSSITGTVYMC